MISWKEGVTSTSYINSMLIVYYHPRCGTVKKAIKWLSERKISFEIRDLTEKPIERELLERYWELSKLPIKKFFNTSGQSYKMLGLSEKINMMDEQACLNILATDGLLVKRPIVTDGLQITVGFKEEEFEKCWGESQSFKGELK